MRKATILISTLVMCVSAGCKPAEHETGPEPVFTSTTEEDITADAAGGTYSLTYFIENPAADGNVEADSETGWIGGYDTSVSGKVTFDVAANDTKGPREAKIVVTYSFSSGNPQSFEVNVRQDAEADEVQMFSIEVSEITSTTARVVTTCQDPAMTYTTQMITEKDFNDNVGDKALIGEYLINYMRDMAEQYYYEFNDFVKQFVVSGTQDRIRDGLLPDSRYMTYAMGMDTLANITTEVYWGPEFSTEAVEVSDLELAVDVKPNMTNAEISVVPTDDLAWYYITVIEQDVYEYYGYTDEDIMAAICAEEDFMLRFYCYQGKNTTTKYGLAPGVDYYAAAFGVDLNTNMYNTQLFKEPFTTVASQPTDAYVEGTVLYWDTQELYNYNPSYGQYTQTSLLGVVDLAFNESATEAYWYLYPGDYSSEDQELLYNNTVSLAYTTAKGDPAMIMTMDYDVPVYTLCVIGRDAAGNFGDMDVTVVNVTKDGASGDFALFDEYLAAYNEAQED